MRGAVMRARRSPGWSAGRRRGRDAVDLAMDRWGTVMVGESECRVGTRRNGSRGAWHWQSDACLFQRFLRRVGGHPAPQPQRSRAHEFRPVSRSRGLSPVGSRQFAHFGELIGPGQATVARDVMRDADRSLRPTQSRSQHSPWSRLQRDQKKSQIAAEWTGRACHQSGISSA